VNISDCVEILMTCVDKGVISGPTVICSRFKVLTAVFLWTHNMMPCHRVNGSWRSIQNSQSNSPDTVSHSVKMWNLNYWFLHHDNTPAHQVLSKEKFMAENSKKKLDWDIYTIFGSQWLLDLPINFKANVDMTNLSGHWYSENCGCNTERYSKSIKSWTTGTTLLVTLLH
jgi:hypothetical protein